jgi:flagellar motility protein MotE (MotC chaperone)
LEPREFSSAWRTLQSNKCGNCGKRVPNDAEFGKGKHAVVVEKRGLETWCDSCYDKEIEDVQGDVSKKEREIRILKQRIKDLEAKSHELDDSEKEKLK